eukprot:6990202-Prymnesium_polylepis.1
MLSLWLGALLASSEDCSCSQHGYCDDAGVCTCYPGWTADDCSERAECPASCNLRGPPLPPARLTLASRSPHARAEYFRR